MSTSDRASSAWVVLGCFTQVPPSHSIRNGITGKEMGPVNDELAGTAKSACMRQSKSSSTPKVAMAAGVFLGGRFLRNLVRRVPMLPWASTVSPTINGTCRPIASGI